MNSPINGSTTQPITIAGLIFDMDGTLGDTLPVCFAGFHHALGAFGIHMTDAEIVAHFGPTEEGIIRKLVAPTEGDRAARLYREEYERAHDMCPDPFPGIREMLTWLHARGVRLALATGKGAHGAHVSLRRFGIEHLLDAIECGSDEKFVKPDLLRRIAAQWADLAPAALAYVGDTPWDIDAAREVGMHGIAAAWDARADRAALAAKSPLALFTSVDAMATWLGERVR